MQTLVHDTFTTLFGGKGRTYSSAGRINLIGEHTDYNGGYVFPGAIDKGITAEIKPNGTAQVQLYSIDYKASCSFGLEEKMHRRNYGPDTYSACAGKFSKEEEP